MIRKVQAGRVSFEATPKEAAVIHAIALRAVALLRKDIRLRMMDVEMDITATHANGNPLRLSDLL